MGREKKTEVLIFISEKPLNEVFSRFDDTPLGAASIGQVLALSLSFLLSHLCILYFILFNFLFFHFVSLTYIFIGTQSYVVEWTRGSGQTTIS